MAISVGIISGCNGSAPNGFITVFVESNSLEDVQITLTGAGGVGFEGSDTGTTVGGGGSYSYSHQFNPKPSGTYQVQVSGSLSGSDVTYDDPQDVTLACTPPCDLVIDSIVVVDDTNGQSLGSITIDADSGGTIEAYSIDGGMNQFPTGVFTGIPAGTYTIWVKDNRGCIVLDEVTVSDTACGLAITDFDKTDETDEDLNDGTATIAATSTGAMQIRIDGGLYESFPGTKTYTGLAPGLHVIDLKDSFNCTTSQSFTIEEIIVNTPHVFVPIVNSLRFVPVTTPDNCSVFQTMDNTLFHDQVYPGHKKGCYHQLVNKCDLLKIQWQSNYENNSITLTNVRTLEETVFEAVVATLPEDYVLPTEYNIVEAELNLSGLANGYYSVKMEGDDPNMPDYLFRGEPIHLHANHENTCLISYRNIDQQNEIEYLTGIIHKIRVNSRFNQPSYPFTKQIFTDGIGSTINLSSRVKRKMKLVTFQLPPYMHEQIIIALSLDEVKVNNIQFTCEEDYKITYYNQWNLAGGEVDLTQTRFAVNNSHDSGNIDTAVPGIIGVEGALLGY
jgi:hypothetical protein